MSLEIKDVEATMNRLLDATGASTQSELAKILNISKAAISHSMQRSRLPLEWVLKAHYTLGVNARYVLDGELPKHVSMKLQSEGSEEYVQAGQTIYVQIPIMDNFLNEDNKFVQTTTNTPFVFLPRNKVNNLTANSDNLFGMFANSSDMEPTLSKNDIMVVNKNECKPEPNSLYLFESGGYCFPRRIVFAAGSFYIQNDTGGESELFSKTQFRCMGKILFYCHFVV